MFSKFIRIRKIRGKKTKGKMPAVWPPPLATRPPFSSLSRGGEEGGERERARGVEGVCVRERGARERKQGKEERVFEVSEREVGVGGYIYRYIYVYIYIIYAHVYI